MTLNEYDAFTSGLSESPWIQGFDVATMQVPVASGVSPNQPAGATVKQGMPGNGAMKTNGKPLTTKSALGQPWTWWLFLVGAHLGLNWLAKRYNAPRFTLIQYVIVVIHFAVVITALKVLLTRFTIPGLSPLVIALLGRMNQGLLVLLALLLLYLAVTGKYNCVTAGFKCAFGGAKLCECQGGATGGQPVAGQKPD